MTAGKLKPKSPAKPKAAGRSKPKIKAKTAAARTKGVRKAARRQAVGKRKSR
jgi:hypothetical protein